MRPYLVNTIGATYGTCIHFFTPGNLADFFFSLHCRVQFLWWCYDIEMISDNNTGVLFH